MRLYIFIVLILMSTSASSRESGSEVKRLYVNKQGWVLFTLEDGVNEKPACNTNNIWDFGFKLSENYGREMYSALLSAHATGKSIIVGHGDTCFSEFPSVAVSYLYFSE